MPECSATCVTSKAEVPGHVESILKEHKVVVFTHKDEKKGDDIVSVLKELDVKDLCVKDVDQCSQKDELMSVLKQKTSCSSTPYVFICGKPYCGAERALSDSAEKDKLKKHLHECACSG